MSIIRTLSTYHSFRTSQRTVTRTKTELELLGKELSTGLKADVARELGIRSAQSYNLRNMMEQNNSFTLGNKLLDNKLEVFTDAIGNVRELSQEFANFSINNSTVRTGTATAMQTEAKAKLEAIITALNSNYNGDFLFSGIDSEVRAVEFPNDGPLAQVEALMGPAITDLADAQAKVQIMDDIFDNNYAADPSLNFDELFYNGAPADGARLKAKIDNNNSIEYGVQANDTQFKNVLQGLYMLSAVDPYEITDPAAYKEYVGTAVDRITNGIEQIIEGEAVIGAKHAAIANAIILGEDKNTILNNRIAALEFVDFYEAQTRMQALETQMQATFSTTAKLSRLTILDYLR